MAVCCCSLAGTAACKSCANNPFAMDVGTNKTVTVDHIDAKPFGNGLNVCPVCHGTGVWRMDGGQDDD